MKIKNNLVFVLGLILALGLSACISLSEDLTPPPGAEVVEPVAQKELIEDVFPLNDPDAEAGKAIFTEKCAPCHGDLGLGDGPQSLNLPVPVAPIGTFNLAMMQTPQEWFSLITLGNLESFMPPFSGSLDGQDRWDVMAYVYSLGVDELFIADGQVVYQENCENCHGIEGKGDGPDSDSAADFTDQEKMVAISGVNVVQAVAPGMGPEWHSAEGLEMDDYFSVAAYVRTLSFEPLYAGLAVSPENVPTDEDSVPEEPTLEEVAFDDTENETSVVSVTGMVTYGDFEVLPEGVSVDLLGYNEFDQNLSVSSVVAEDGSFLFEEIEFFEGMVLIASVDYKGATYSSNFIIYSPDMDEVEVLINIYDSTSDTSELVADRLHIFFLFDSPDVVQVVQVWLLSNYGDKTISPISDIEPVVQFNIPEDAQNLLFDNDQLGGGRFVTTEDGFGDLQPLIPGLEMAQIVYAFEMPYKNKLSLNQILKIPVNELLIFIPSIDIDVQADNLLPEGIQDLNGTEFLTYSMNLESDDIEINLKGRHPVTTEGVGLDPNQLNLILGITGFLVVAVGVVIWWRNNSKRDEIDYEDDQIETSAAILDEIISLDKAYEDGQIEIDDYTEQREVLKNELKKAMESGN